MKGEFLMKKLVFSKCKILKFICIFVGVLVFAAPFSSMAADDPLGIKVMTRNLYLGADIFRVVQNPTPYEVRGVFDTMLYTDFWARAEGIADEIAANQPQVIGLQEVEDFYIQTPGDIYPNHGTTPATNPVINFYQVLNDALIARGMYYQAFSVTNADVELPMADPAAPPYYLSDVRMVDHDYILVRKGNAATISLIGNYTVNFGGSIGGIPVTFTRGYLAVDVNISGQVYRFVSTHPEIRDGDPSYYRWVQSKQIEELLSKLGTLVPKPTIMVGDFNSSPEDSSGSIYGLNYTPPYKQIVAAGYLDTWLLQTKKHDAGLTDGFNEEVNNPNPAQLKSRIDLVFLKTFGLLSLDTIKCDVIGNNPDTDMVLSTNGQYMLWPSDHAGVVVKFKFLP
jgi:endonuclease/exonuclease/phosphatase family metal-dependent hydrolase